MTEATHYQTLGVDPSATQDQIRRAYRAAAKAHHPDVNSADDAPAKFARIAVAYEVLSDRRRRAAYDLSLSSPPDRRPAPSPAHYTWTNIATEQAERAAARATEFDELYETFFTPHKPAE